MALRKCTCCDTPLLASAKTCTRCGRPNREPVSVSWLIFTLLVLCAVLAFNQFA